MSVRTFVIATLALIAYAFGPTFNISIDPLHTGLTVTTYAAEETTTSTPVTVAEPTTVSHETYPVLNPNPALTSTQRAAIVDCDTDTDCVTKNPRVIPDVYTIDDYLRVWGDNIQFPTLGNCDSVDWFAQDGDGRWFVPFDANHDGFIDCGSDVELGS